MQYLGNQTWENTERVRFDYDHQSVFFDGLHIQKVFPGGVEHLLDGLGNNPTLPKVEILVLVEKIRGQELYPIGMESEDVEEEMDDEWILQPARNSPIVCCGKYLYVDKDVSSMPNGFRFLTENNSGAPFQVSSLLEDLRTNLRTHHHSDSRREFRRLLRFP